MNKVLKIAIIVVLCLIVILTITLFACDPGSGNDCTEHIDADSNEKCDVCGADVPKPQPPACTEHKDENGDEKCDVCNADVPKPQPPVCTEHKDEDGDEKCDVCNADVPKPQPPVCTEHKDENGDEKCDVCNADVPKPQPPVTDGFTNADGTVYVISIELNVRTSPEIGDNEHSAVVYGTALTRTGYNDKWTRINIDGTDYYVSSDCVSLEKPILVTEFEQKNDTVYVTTDSLSARSTPFYDAEGVNIIKSFAKGAILKRTGVATREYDGILWSRVEIEVEEEVDGVKKTVTKTAYISTKYLANENPFEKPTISMVFTSCTWKVTILADGFNYRNVPVYEGVDAAGSFKKNDVIVLNGYGTEEDGTVWGRFVHSEDNETYYLIIESSKTPGKIEIDKSYVPEGTQPDPTPDPDPDPDPVPDPDTKVDHELFGGNVEITLPAELAFTKQDSQGYHFESELAYVLVGYVVNENPAIKSEADLANATVAAVDGLAEAGIQARELDGVTYIAYTTRYPGESATLYTLVTFTKGEGEGYCVTEFHCDYSNYLDLITGFFSCAKSINVK